MRATTRRQRSWIGSTERLIIRFQAWLGGSRRALPDAARMARSAIAEARVRGLTGSDDAIAAALLDGMEHGPDAPEA